MRPTNTAGPRLATTGLGLALVFGLVAHPAVARPPEPSAASGGVPVIDHKSRSFRIPFNIDPSERSRIKEVLLTVSDDQGRTWKPISRTTPDRPALAYRAARDGEYWFAVQTMDTDGRLYPVNSSAIEPRMKVVVDTVAPTVSVKSNGRRGSLASVRWEIRDDRLDRGSFALEFQAEGAQDWRLVPVRRPTPLIGEATWDAGTAEPIRVRASVADKAGNLGDATLLLPDGTPENPAIGRGAPSGELTEPPPLGSFTSADGPTRSRAPTPAPAPAPEALPQVAALPTEASPPAYNPFEAPARPAEAPAGVAEGGQKPQLIRSPRFNLNYEVEDAGPDGPATVELWVTQNGGRTWSPRGDDPDRKSPFPVDLGGEGTFGLSLVAKSSSNLGDQPPGPGDPPQYLVEVDSTVPMVKLDRVQVGQGPDAGKVQVIWHASDLHLGARPVVISVRADGAGGPWQPITPAIENSGQFIWTLPASAPKRFHVRVDVVDTVGNRGSDETVEGKPVIVDRTRPKSRIIGLDPAAQNATGPIITPLR